MSDPAAVKAILFTDIEGSTRLWEREPKRMRAALAQHDRLARDAVTDHAGTLVKSTGDGIYAIFPDPRDALDATLGLLRALACADATAGLPLALRCGLHLGAVQYRDGDYFGTPVNRAARIMAAAHGGQLLVSQAVAALVADRLPEGASLRDLGSVRLRDLAQPEHLYQVVHPALRQEFPALRSLEATPNNLPQQVSSFIGRKRELGQVRTLLAQTRLLTLLGTGGIGKTRLSLQAAVESLDAYADGVWFVELAALTDPRLVAQAVASALGVVEEGGRPVVEALVHHVRERCLLLILDNCEHLVDACAEISAALLQAGPQLSILASSREPLRVPGETTYPVPPLGVPDAGVPGVNDELVRCDAVRLFADRAGAAVPDFRVTRDNAAAVAEICRRLDGIPLALELAAARLRVLSPEKIAARLDDCFRMLTGGSRSALPRQQTLRALIDWSHDLLTEAERVLLRRLAVFAGGWTLESAEAVGAGGTIMAADVLDLLTRLAEKSLVVVESGGDRYRLLETVRQYARERLVEAGEANDAHWRHLAFFLALAGAAKTGLDGSEQVQWLDRLDLERENLLAAHAWCDEDAAHAEAGLQLVEPLTKYWVFRGLLALGQRVTAEALDRPAAQARTMARCQALHGAGWLACFTGCYEPARAVLEESLDIARAMGDESRVAAVLQPLAFAVLGLGDLPAARSHSEEGLAIARRKGDRRQIAAALTGLAQVCRMQGDTAAAEPMYEQALALERELGARESVAIGLLNLAMVAISRQATTQAGEFLAEALAIVVATGARRTGQSALDVCAGLGAARGEAELAARLYGAAQALADETGSRRDPTDDAFLAPLMAQARTTLGPLRFTAEESAGGALAYDAAVALARGWLDRAC